MKRLGPDLKDLKLRNLKLAGGLRAPKPVRDLYLDLRDRRLLPLLALLLVAIVAIPILLSDGAGDEEGLTRAPGPTGVRGEAASVAVVEANPGLRDYRKRLKARSATDPFKQRYTAPITKGAELQSQSTTSGGDPTSTSTTDGSQAAPSLPPGVGSGGGGSGSGGGGSASPDRYRIYTFTLNVQISRSETLPDGSTKMSEPEIRKGVRAPKPLPSEKKPVLTFLGVKAKSATSLKALMLVSDDVTGVFGEAECVSGTEQCELLAVEPGFPVVLEYGDRAVRYRFKVTKIDVVETGRAEGTSGLSALQ